MVSFFGLKFGDKKKKSDGKATQAQPPAKQPQERRKIDQNLLGEGQFFGQNVHRTGVVNGSIRSVSRAGTPLGDRSRSPFAPHDTHNLAAASMYDLSTTTAPVMLRAHASDANLHSRLGVGNGSSVSLALPGPMPYGSRPGTANGSRPGTANGKNKVWVNPLDVHFMRGTPSPAPRSPLAQPDPQFAAEMKKEETEKPALPADDKDGDDGTGDMMAAVMMASKMQEQEDREAREREKEKQKMLEKQRELARSEEEKSKAPGATATVETSQQPYPQAQPQAQQRSPPQGQPQRSMQGQGHPQPRSNGHGPQGPVFRGNVDQRPDSRNGLHANGPNGPSNGYGPGRLGPHHTGPPPTGPPTQCLPQPPGQAGPPRQGPRGPPGENNNSHGPRPAPGFGPGPGPGPGRGYGPGPGPNGPGPNGPGPRPYGSGPQHGPHHGRQPGPHPAGPGGRGAAGSHDHGPGPNRGRPYGPGPGPGPAPGQFHGPGAEGFRSQSPAPRGMGPGPHGFRSQSPGPNSRGFPSEQRSQSPAPRQNGHGPNGFRPQNPSAQGLGIMDMPRTQSPAPMRGPAGYASNGFGPGIMDAPRTHSPAPMSTGPAGYSSNGPGPVITNMPRSQSPAPMMRSPTGYSSTRPSPPPQSLGRMDPPNEPGLASPDRSAPLLSTLASTVTSPAASSARTSINDDPIEQFARPIIQEVQAKRDTLALHTPRTHSLSMKIEELEKTLLEARQDREAAGTNRASTTSSRYSGDIGATIVDDNEPPRLSIQPAPLRISPSPGDMDFGPSSPSPKSQRTPFSPPRRGEGPRRPGLNEYGISTSQLATAGRRPGPKPMPTPSTSSNDSISPSSPTTRVELPQLRQPSGSHDQPRPSPIVDTGFNFQFDVGPSVAAAPPTPDSTNWPLGTSVSPTSPSAPPSSSLPLPERTAEAQQPKFLRAKAPPALDLRFDFSPTASSRDPTLSGPWTPPLRSTPGGFLSNDGRPSTSGGLTTTSASSGGLAASPRLIPQNPKNGLDVDNDEGGTFLGIGMARGPSIREVRRPQGQGMVDRFGYGFI